MDASRARTEAGALAALLALLLATGCGSEALAPFEPTPNVGSRVDFFVQVAELDVLFVIDNSGSMQDEQEDLARNFRRFVDQLERFDVDYHIGVISTDVETGSHRGQLQGRPAFITPRTSGGSAAFRRNVNLGATGSANERGLLAAALALSKEVRDGRNRGFIRPFAPLAVIFVSDEDDQGDEAPGKYIRMFKNAKEIGNDLIVNAYAIVGLEDTACPSPVERGERYLEVVKGFNGVERDICEPDFGDALETLSDAALQNLRRFPLTCTPEPLDSLRVFENGVEIPMSEVSGWIFDADARAIVFPGSHVPPPEASIEVGYDFGEGCQ